MQGVFDRALEHVLAFEGGEVDDPHDPGGHTNRGITQSTLARCRREYRKADLPASVSDLEYEHVRFIYQADYWDKCRCSDLPAAVAVLVFDAAVNQGAYDAAVFLQVASGSLVDGLIGPVTIAEVGHCDAGKLAREYAALRGHDYALLDHLDDIYGLGWMRRLFACYDLATSLI